MHKLKSIMVFVLFAVLLITATAQASKFTPSVKGKKLIASGWHLPSASYVRENIKDLEKLPFDGMLLGDFMPFWTNMRGQQADLDQHVKDIKAIGFSHFTDNFVSVESGNDDFDWFDEARCKDMINNWRVLIRAVKQSGAVGIKFDPECYEGPSPFNYDSLLAKDKKTPEECAARVEKVASEIMKVINEEYPDIKILLYFGPSVAGYPRNLKGWCGMMPGFVDGMLKEAKPGFVIIDGFESAYGYRTEKQYAEARQKMLDTAKHSAYPDKYRKHVQVGFAVWPDNMHGQPLIGRISFNVDDISRNYYIPNEFAYAANNALKYADEYVWMWAESFDVWNARTMVYDQTGKWEFKPIPPGYLEALAEAKKASVPAPAPRKISSTIVTYTAKSLGETEDSKVFANLLNDYNDIATLPVNWKFLPDNKNKGLKAGYYMTGYDDSAWPTIRIREIWDNQGFPETMFGWYRLKWQAPQVPSGKKIYLAFGAVDEAAYVYVNGKLAGFHDIEPDLGYIETFKIDVTKYLIPGQENTIAVKVKNTIGVGGIWRGIKLISEK